MGPKSRTAYETVRTSWIDLIKEHGFSEEYDRANYERARSHWTAYTDGDDWHTAGIEAHRAYWAGLGRACNSSGCDLHGDEDVLDESDSSILYDDYFGPGVYQPETDPVKIAAAEVRLGKIREGLNRPAW